MKRNERVQIIVFYKSFTRFAGSTYLVQFTTKGFDINSSASFYKEVFGWNIRQRGDGATAFDDTVGEVSGAWVTGRKPMTDVGLLFYIMVDDIQATIDKVVANGGKIVQQVGMDAPKRLPQDLVTRQEM